MVGILIVTEMESAVNNGWTCFILAVSIAGNAFAQEPELDAPPADWMKDNMPYGADVTLDGKMWINMNQVGTPDDYAVLANDLYRVRQERPTSPTVWIRGYHLRNTSVPYRETKALLNIDCEARQFSFRTLVRYDGKGRLLEQVGQSARNYIIPGSYADNWAKMICAHFSGSKR